MRIRLNGQQLDDAVYSAIIQKVEAVRTQDPTSWDRMLYPLPVGLLGRLKLLCHDAFKGNR